MTKILKMPNELMLTLYILMRFVIQAKQNCTYWFSLSKYWVNKLASRTIQINCLCTETNLKRITTYIFFSFWMKQINWEMYVYFNVESKSLHTFHVFKINQQVEKTKWMMKKEDNFILVFQIIIFFDCDTRIE